MNNRNLIGVLLSCMILFVGICIWPKKEAERHPAIASESAHTPVSPPVPQEKLVQQVGTLPKYSPENNLPTALAQAVLKPLRLYGVVVDQEGNPVPGASVGFSVSNKIVNTESILGSTRGETRTDPDGRFEISERGMGISVRVSKDGYYQVLGDDPRASARGFYNGDNPGKIDKSLPPSSAPAVFVLRKMGKAIPLVQFKSGSIMVDRNGTPTEISLTTGKNTPPGKGDLRVEAWTNDEAPNAKGRYDWRCRLAVPGGGLAEARGNFAFEAPESGYTQSVELGEKADQPRWLGDAERQFFVRLADGRHARIKFSMIAGGAHYFVIESTLNPEPGSRNLEAAPTPKPVIGSR